MRTMLAISVGLLFGIPPCLGVDIRPSDAIELFQVATAGIHSFDVQFRVTIERLAKEEVGGFAPKDSAEPGAPIIRYRPFRDDETKPATNEMYRQVRQGTGGRLETMDPGSNRVIDVLAGKNDEWKGMKPGASDAIIRPEPFQALPEGVDYRSLFQNARGTADLLTIFRSRKRLKVESKTNDAGRDTIIIDAPPEADTNLNSIGFTVKLDPQFGFLPCQIDDYVIEGGSKVIRRQTLIRAFEKIGPSSWVPIRAETTYFDAQATDNPIPVRRRVVVVDVARSSWNKPIAEHLFDIAIPPGTSVYDDWKKTRSVIGAPTTEKHLDTIVDQGKRLMETAQPPLSQVKGSAYFWLKTSALTLAVGVAIYLWRRQKFGV